MEVWYTIDPRNVKRHHDHQAMAGLLCSVLQEMWQMPGHKKMVKEAWARKFFSAKFHRKIRNFVVFSGPRKISHAGQIFQPNLASRPNHAPNGSETRFAPSRPPYTPDSALPNPKSTHFPPNRAHCSVLPTHTHSRALLPSRLGCAGAPPALPARAGASPALLDWDDAAPALPPLLTVVTGLRCWLVGRRTKV